MACPHCVCFKPYQFSPDIRHFWPGTQPPDFIKKHKQDGDTDELDDDSQLIGDDGL
jgi:hypothetical protein